MNNKLKECYDIVHSTVRSLSYNDETKMYEFRTVFKSSTSRM